ncbi:MAG: glycerate kinase [Burkholderiaceae bacterium]
MTSGDAATDPARSLLLAMFEAAVAAADPARTLAGYLPPRPAGRIIVVGAGKASAAMARAVEAAWPDGLQGLVITPYGTRADCRQIELVEARHPVPDAAGEQAARRILKMVSGLGTDDLVLCLISGGGSALLSVPADGLTLADKQQVNKALLRSGAAIDEMNCVRKHLSAIKGGRLAAAAAPATVLTLAISDVPGDDPRIIASGPTVGNDTQPADALAIIRRFGIDVPPRVLDHLASPAAKTPGTDDPRLAGARCEVICRPQASLEAAADVARSHGYAPLILGDALEGEARDVGLVMAGIARQVCRHDQPAPAPVALISGGETTVTISGEGGRGGRNAEFLLALAVALGDAPRVTALACDTDGIDGSENNAGAMWTPALAARARALGISAVDHLDRHDAFTYFEAIDGLVTTGPTGTNVNDFRVVLIDPPDGARPEAGRQ